MRPRPLAALSLAALAAASCDPRGLGLSNPDFLVIGHRGSPNLVAENTIASFEVAAAVGANAIETDVVVMQDGQLALWHDRDPDSEIALSRQAGAEGLEFVPKVPPAGSSWRRPVSALTLQELRDHYGYGPVGGKKDPTTPIASVPDLLAWLAREPRMKAVYLDVKMAPGEREHAVQLLRLLAADTSVAHVRFIFLSVDRATVDALEAARAELGVDSPRVAWDFEGPGALKGMLAAGLRDVSTGIVPSVTWGDFKEEIAAIVSAREAGRVESVTAWTVDEELKMAEMLYYSVDGLMTNEPALLHRMWRDSLD